MSNILVGEAAWEKMVRPTKVENLWVIPSGPIPPNPAELVSSEAMQELIQGLRGQYDRILIDSPPIMAVTDSVALSRLTDGLVLVIKVGVTARDLVANSVRQLRDMNAKILGTVLNDIPYDNDHYYYYHYYYYYYGEEQTRGKKKLWHLKGRGGKGKKTGRGNLRINSKKVGEDRRIQGFGDSGELIRGDL